MLRFARAPDWWWSKIPPLLAIAYLTLLETHADFTDAIVLLGCYVFSICCVATYGHGINDACDVEADLQAGKHNEMVGTGWGFRALFGVTFLAAGFAPTLIANYSTAALVLLAANYVWPTIYSMPAVRLKERGILGVVCDIMGAHVTPTLLALVVFGAVQPNSPIEQLGYPLIATLWATALGIKGILHHQIMDRDNDIRSGTATFVTAANRDAVMRFLTWFNLLVEMPVSIAVVAIVFPWCPLAAVGLAIYCTLEATKYVRGFRFALDVEVLIVRASIPFANEMFYTLWLPLAAAVQLAASGPAWLFLPVLQVVLFREVFRVQAGDLRAVAVNLGLPLRRRRGLK